MATRISRIRKGTEGSGVGGSRLSASKPPKSKSGGGGGGLLDLVAVLLVFATIGALQGYGLAAEVSIERHNELPVPSPDRPVNPSGDGGDTERDAETVQRDAEQARLREEDAQRQAELRERMNEAIEEASVILREGGTKVREAEELRRRVMGGQFRDEAASRDAMRRTNHLYEEARDMLEQAREQYQRIDREFPGAGVADELDRIQAQLYTCQKQSFPSVD